MLLRFDRARSGCPVGSKTVSGRARSGVFRVDFSGSRVFLDHVAHSSLIVVIVVVVTEAGWIFCNL